MLASLQLLTPILILTATSRLSFQPRAPVFAVDTEHPVTCCVSADGVIFVPSPHVCAAAVPVMRCPHVNQEPSCENALHPQNRAIQNESRPVNASLPHLPLAAACPPHLHCVQPSLGCLAQTLWPRRGSRLPCCGGAHPFEGVCTSSSSCLASPDTDRGQGPTKTRASLGLFRRLTERHASHTRASLEMREFGSAALHSWGREAVPRCCATPAAPSSCPPV